MESGLHSETVAMCLNIEYFSDSLTKENIKTMKINK